MSKTKLSAGLFSSKSSEWRTPENLYRELDEEFNFDLDPCTSPENHLGTPNSFSKKDDGLSRDWFGRVFMNPPYGRKIAAWVKKAYDEVRSRNAELVVGLLPARTDTSYFHDYILDVAEEIRFIRGRLRFSGAKSGAPFPSMIVIWRSGE